MRKRTQPQSARMSKNFNTIAIIGGQDGDRGTGSGISPRKAPEKAAKPMRLEEYLDKASVGLERSDVKEATVGFTQRGVEVWRKAFEPVMNGFGIDA